MKKKRLIPVILLKNGWVVQSKSFRYYQNLGNPTQIVKRLSEWASDEIIYLDITRDEKYDLRRDDLAGPNRADIFQILTDVSKMCFMPVTVGGNIRSLKDIEKRLSLGADKVCVNTEPLRNKAFIKNAAKEFGSQCIVVSIDAKKIDGVQTVFADGGRERTPHAAEDWAAIAEAEGAGEILLNSIDRDGMKTGYDLELVGSVAKRVKIPVIACGGVGEWAHFAEVFQKTRADAAAAANIFHYRDQSVYLAKKYLYDQRCSVRSPELLLIHEGALCPKP